jgi:hypothetical protein
VDIATSAVDGGADGGEHLVMIASRVNTTAPQETGEARAMSDYECRSTLRSPLQFHERVNAQTRGR